MMENEEEEEETEMCLEMMRMSGERRGFLFVLVWRGETMEGGGYVATFLQMCPPSPPPHHPPSLSRRLGLSQDAFGVPGRFSRPLLTD